MTSIYPAMVSRDYEGRNDPREKYNRCTANSARVSYGKVRLLCPPPLIIQNGNSILTSVPFSTEAGQRGFGFDKAAGSLIWECGVQKHLLRWKHFSLYVSLS